MSNIIWHKKKNLLPSIHLIPVKILQAYLFLSRGGLAVLGAGSPMLRTEGRGL